MKTNYEARCERIDRLRVQTQNRADARWWRLEALAEPMIGELQRSGRTVYYTWPRGGRYFESGSYTEVVERLIRNRWVR